MASGLRCNHIYELTENGVAEETLFYHFRDLVRRPALLILNMPAVLLVKKLLRQEPEVKVLEALKSEMARCQQAARNHRFVSMSPPTLHFQHKNNVSYR